jgi:phospholipid/cholesterol/gamma-HCH transport system substrate-binding protein
VRAKVKSFEERNPYIIGLIGAGMIFAIIVGALNFTKLPFLNQTRTLSAYFVEGGGLLSGAAVQVSGFPVGSVRNISLDGNRVFVTFVVDKSIRIGDRSEAAIKTKSVLGAKILEVFPRGDGEQDGPIPLDRTKSPYQLPDALGDLSMTISGLNTNQVSDSLDVLANTFKDTPPELKVAVQGVARFSETLDKRDADLRTLLSNAKKVTGVLADRSDQIVALLADTNTLLVQLRTQSSALDSLSGNIVAATQQIKGFITDQRDTLKPALDKLNGVLATIANRKKEIQTSIQGLNRYALALGESVSSGPFFKAYLANLFPGQFVQPFVDAAFSDLGLDPNVLLPTQRGDPQTEQPGTPPLPVPYPRTGQGGDPNLTLPGAITGNPGDPRYPYREPLPAPPPGGPPPGPPAGYEPTPQPAAPATSGPAAPGPAGVTVVPLPSPGVAAPATPDAPPTSEGGQP